MMTLLFGLTFAALAEDPAVALEQAYQREFAFFELLDDRLELGDRPFEVFDVDVHVFGL